MAAYFTVNTTMLNSTEELHHSAGRHLDVPGQRSLERSP
jgi:hypothetical protein